jgi:hypothetical protein
MTDKPTLDTAKLAVLDEVHTESTPKAPRATHTPAERATDAANILARRLAKLTKSRAALELQARELEPQIVAMQARLDYALHNPDLPEITDEMRGRTTPEPQKTTSAEGVAEEARRDALQQPRAWRNQP